MTPMAANGIPQILSRGIEAAARGQYALALPMLSAVYQVVPADKYPQGLSSYGLCLSKIEHKNKAGAELCEKAIAVQPYDGLHWANLVRLYIGVKNRKKAVDVLEKGLKKLRGDETLIKVRKEIGYRKAPYFRFLRRQHPLNKLYSRVSTGLERRAKPILLTLGSIAYVALMVAIFLAILQ
jgi:tetratricopeptide (TPR) repeat protein